jgi:aspartate/methionine/tyrosine aminotransferase
MPAWTADRLAARTHRIAPFEVMELIGRAARLREAGKPVIQLDIGEPDFAPPPRVLEALARIARDGNIRYTPATGLRSLREAIAEDYARRYGLSIRPERIIVTAGASAALLLACAALVNPGDRVLMTDPSYPCNRHFVSAFDGLPEALPSGPAQRFQMTAEMVDTHWNDNTRGVLLASPANPTGTAIEASELRAIVEAVRQKRGFTIVDEIYLGISFDGPARSALALGDDLIVVNSFSKYFSMTGWRLGWLVSPPELVPVFEKLAQNLFICASAIAQQAALACFDAETLALCEARRAELQTRRDLTLAWLEQAGLSVPVRPDGAFYVYADCSGTGLDSTTFAARLLDEEYVSLVPGMDFGRNRQEAYLRISFASPIDQIEEAAKRIKRFVTRYAKVKVDERPAAA